MLVQVGLSQPTFDYLPELPEMLVIPGHFITVQGIMDTFTERLVLMVKEFDQRLIAHSCQSKGPIIGNTGVISKVPIFPAVIKRDLPAGQEFNDCATKKPLGTFNYYAEPDLATQPGFKREQLMALVQPGRDALKGRELLPDGPRVGFDQRASLDVQLTDLHFKYSRPPWQARKNRHNGRCRGT